MADADASPGVGEFRYDSPLVRRRREFADYARPSFREGVPLLAAVLDLTGRIHAEFAFDPKATTVATPLEQVLRERRGVCQDFAHLQIACLRSLGLAARYVSGYLETVPPPGRPKLTGTDASHAWLAVFCPGHGLDRRGPDEQPAAVGSAHHGGLGARLQRREPDSRGHRRRRAPSTQGRGGCRTAR